MTHFEEQAANWLAWARTPGHDVYWSYRDAFFELVPPPGRATLEIGCGEGRVARDLAERGHTVTGIDTSLTLSRAAAEAHPEGTYAIADAAGLAIEALREPASPLEPERPVPMFLMLRAARQSRL